MRPWTDTDTDMGDHNKFHVVYDSRKMQETYFYRTSAQHSYAEQDSNSICQ